MCAGVAWRAGVSGRARGAAGKELLAPRLPMPNTNDHFLGISLRSIALTRDGVAEEEGWVDR